MTGLRVRNRRALPPCPIAAVLVGAALVLGCSNRPAVVREGPPPTVAEDGYRHHHAGMTLIYEAELGVYRVGSLEDHFFHDGRFYRFFQGSWYAAPHVIGPWAPAPAAALPEALRASVR